MGKTAYFFTTFVGAIPAGFCLYALVMTFVNHGEVLSHMMLGITITASFFTFLVVLTPLMVLIFYKDSMPKAVKPPKKKDDEEDAAVEKDDDGGFGDAIPDDFDEDELRESADDEDFEDLDAEYDDGGFDDEDYDDEDFGDFDYDDD